MDDGVVEISDHAVDTFVDEFLKNTRTCSQTHTCNPPGPDAAHTYLLPHPYPSSSVGR
ncbi:PREDICTED: basic leucine zipper [Prunus dulcis]|uniref:PREDICTED: basic leucine zipper n=1 Tax=Prunus dulcis TaxID=3755 RepID=A0A5E4G155_PRUDU|nr:PREDICTED: basic leucine zipper [Prunus dulcis]